MVSRRNISRSKTSDDVTARKATNGVWTICSRRSPLVRFPELVGDIYPAPARVLHPTRLIVGLGLRCSFVIMEPHAATVTHLRLWPSRLLASPRFLHRRCGRLWSVWDHTDLTHPSCMLTCTLNLHTEATHGTLRICVSAPSDSNPAAVQIVIARRHGTAHLIRRLYRRLIIRQCPLSDLRE